MSDGQAIAIVAPIFGLITFGPWAVGSLLTGKTLIPRSLFGEIADRKKDPSTYWFSVAVVSGLAIGGLVALVRALISN